MSVVEQKRFLLTLVRHGETELNLQRIVQGQGVDAELNETGKMQARALGRSLSNEHYTHVYSSDQRRARETCEIVMSENMFGKGAGKGARPDIIFDQRIRERCYGEMEGRRRDEYEVMAKNVGQTLATFIPAGAETIPQISNRADDFFIDLCKTCFKYIESGSGEANVLVVSHGRLLATLMAKFSEKYGCPFPPGKLGIVSVNTGQSCFDIQFTKHYLSTGTGSDIPVPGKDSEVDGHKKLIMKCTKFGNSDHLVE